MTSEPAIANRYEQLLDRAERFISKHNGAVHEDLLIQHVFGTTARPDLWRGLLRSVLSESPALGLRGDQCWTTVRPSKEPGSPAHSLTTEDFVVLDVETTGLKPGRHRVIEFGAVRYSGGRELERISQLINPERRIPAYVRKLTGIDDSLVADSPCFADVRARIVAFIGEYPVVGYNTDFDVAFLNTEMKRCGEGPLLNPQIDLLPIAQQALPGNRSRGLESLAKEIGVSPSRAHRALDDALTTAKVLFHLAPSFQEAGYEDLLSLARIKGQHHLPRHRIESVGRGRSILDERFLTNVPNRPGVYVMRGEADRVIYVGKAKDLRARLRSYYSQPLGYTRKMDGLLQAIRDIETIETGSELAALMLEAQLISRYRPQFNRQMRTSDHYPYIRVDISNPWPKVSIARKAAEDGARYYGPFRSSRAAKATVEALNDIFPLRTCNRTFKTGASYGSPCTALDFGKCLGPCAGVADRDEYRGFVQNVVQFLDGDVDPVLERLHTQLERAAEKLDFERAAKLRNRVERVSDLSRAQRLLKSTTDHPLLAVILPAAEEDVRSILLIVFGRPWANIGVSPTDSDAEIAKRLNRAWDRSQHALDDVIAQQDLDLIQILGRWTLNNWGHESIVELEAESPDWESLVAHARISEVLT